MGWEVAADRCQDYGISSRLEWLLPNGLGGYASGTISGANTRGHHGHLVASLRSPSERMVLLASIEATVTARGQKVDLATNQYIGTVHPEGYKLISRFRTGSHAEWLYDVGGIHIRKRLGVHRGLNAVTVEYANVGSQPVQLSLRPLVCHKLGEDSFRLDESYPEELDFRTDETMLGRAGVRLVLGHRGLERQPLTGWFYRFEHAREAEQAREAIDDLFCPCELHATLMPGESVSLVAGVGEAPEPLAFAEVGVEESFRTKIQEAASSFFVEGFRRKSIVAGYPWQPDRGRETMIALPGLAMATGRWEEAKDVLRSYAQLMNRGLIPNCFDDVDGDPAYDTIDATLWFAHAAHLILEHEWDSIFANEALAWFEEAALRHHQGTLFGIGADPADGLLTQRESSHPLTWMDSKVDDWLAAPRHGKPIEVNALWINFLRVIEWLCERLGQDGLRHRLAAEKAESNFESKFWRNSVGHYLDTADPDDAQLRPNQVIAMGLPFCPMNADHARRALAKARRELWTPFGLRTLGPRELGYEGRLEDELRAASQARHQGSAWPWLQGSYVLACLKFGEVAWAHEAMQSFEAMLDQYGLGGVAEAYDGDAPQRPRACPWHAASLAELVRAHTAIQTKIPENSGT